MGSARKIKMNKTVRAQFALVVLVRFCGRAQGLTVVCGCICALYRGLVWSVAGRVATLFVVGVSVAPSNGTRHERLQERVLEQRQALVRMVQHVCDEQPVAAQIA